MNIKVLSVNRGIRFEKEMESQKLLESEKKIEAAEEKEQTYDEALLENIQKCAKWLSGLKAIQNNPKLAQDLAQFNTPSALLRYKAWFLQSVTPIIDTDMNRVINGILADYVLMRTEFLESDITKFENYLKCFNICITK